MATIAELLKAANRKVQRSEETKALLKTRLTEKGLDVASEDNFYNLANKVGEIGNISMVTIPGSGTTELKLDFPVNNFFIILSKRIISGSWVISGVYTSDVNVLYCTMLAGVGESEFKVTTSYDSTTISTSSGKFYNNGSYTVFYW